MHEGNRTEISTLGEFGLIKHLTQDIKLQNPETKYGVGDDAAVLEFPGKQVLVTTDLLMEGVHFDLVYTPLKHLGYKSAMVNFSDIYAMNGTPKQITVSLAVSKRFCIEDLEDFYDGLKLACAQHQVDLVGGDTTSSVTGLAISITCIGEADKDKVVYRNGAKRNRPDLRIRRFGSCLHGPSADGARESRIPGRKRCTTRLCRQRILTGTLPETGSPQGYCGKPG